MIEILQFYVSSFWVWLGLTIGLYCFVIMFVSIMAAIGERRL